MVLEHVTRRTLLTLSAEGKILAMSFLGQFPYFLDLGVYAQVNRWVN
jgi:hypothetical protein